MHQLQAFIEFENVHLLPHKNMFSLKAVRQVILGKCSSSKYVLLLLGRAVGGHAIVGAVEEQRLPSMGRCNAASASAWRPAEPQHRMHVRCCRAPGDLLNLCAHDAVGCSVGVGVGARAHSRVGSRRAYHTAQRRLPWRRGAGPVCVFFYFRRSVHHTSSSWSSWASMKYE